MHDKNPRMEFFLKNINKIKQSALQSFNDGLTYIDFVVICIETQNPEWIKIVKRLDPNCYEKGYIEDDEKGFVIKCTPIKSLPKILKLTKNTEKLLTVILNKGLVGVIIAIDGKARVCGIDPFATTQNTSALIQ